MECSSHLPAKILKSIRHFQLQKYTDHRQNFKKFHTNSYVQIDHIYNNTFILRDSHSFVQTSLWHPDKIFQIWPFKLTRFLSYEYIINLQLLIWIQLILELDTARDGMCFLLKINAQTLTHITRRYSYILTDEFFFFNKQIMVCRTKVLCPQNLFSRKLQRHEGCMSHYMDIRHLCFRHRHVLWLLLTKSRYIPMM